MGRCCIFFLLHSCRECYASAPIVYNVFTFPVERIFEFHSCVNLWPNTSPLSDPILPLLGSFEAAVCLYRLPVQPVNTYTLAQYLDYMMIDTVKMTAGCGSPQLMLLNSCVHFGAHIICILMLLPSIKYSCPQQAAGMFCLLKSPSNKMQLQEVKVDWLQGFKNILFLLFLNLCCGPRPPLAARRGRCLARRGNRLWQNDKVLRFLVLTINSSNCSEAPNPQ